MPVTIDDLQTDFDAAIRRMFEEAKAEHDAIPEDQRSNFYLREAAASLVRILDARPPQIVLEMAEDGVARRLRHRKGERKRGASA